MYKRQVGEKVPYLVAGHSYGGYLVRGLLAAEDSRAAGDILLCPVANPVHAQRVLPPLVPLVEEPAFVQALPQPEREAYGCLLYTSCWRTSAGRE